MENIEVYTTAIGTIIIVIGIALTMAKECKIQIGNMYKRFDQYKEHLERTHVTDKVCGILHAQLNVDIAEIKKDVKELLKKANGGK